MTPRLPAARCPLPSTRSGFTLPELIVALALLSVGALALVAATASAIRTVAEAGSQDAATLAARNRVEELASADCSILRDTAGADSGPSGREWWTVAASRNGTRLIADSIEYFYRDRRQILALRRLVVC